MAEDEAGFWLERPQPSPLERELDNLFWSLKRECEAGAVIKADKITEALEVVEIELDIGLKIIKSVDDHYRHLYAEEQRRKKK